MYVYTPLVKESEYVDQKSERFLERYYDGHISAMLSAYMEGGRLTEEELNSLRALLAEASGERED